MMDRASQRPRSSSSAQMPWLVVLASFVALAMLGRTVAAQQIRPPEVPWGADRARTSPGEPGRSRILPPPTDAFDGGPAGSTPQRRSQRLARSQTSLGQPGNANGGNRDGTAPPGATIGLHEGAGPPQESDPTRRGNWWQDEARPTLPDQHGPHGSRSRLSKGELIPSTQIVAMVGNEPILAGDLLGRINEMLEPYKEQLTEDQLQVQRGLLLQRLLPPAVEAKLVYLDFVRKMKPEQVQSIRDSVFQQFDEKQLPEMVERAKLKSPADLEERMRQLGSSLDTARRSFFEQVAAREMIRRVGKDDREVSHDDLLRYYQEHEQEYRVEAQAKWEKLTARFDKYPDKSQAYRALAAMGNAVLRGKPLEAVAREMSTGVDADLGGQHDWTTQGSLVSHVLDHAIFTLPIGRLSTVLQDETGFHIVRVIERREAGKIPFLEAQVGIRDKIKEERREQKIQEYLAKLKRETFVWTLFDEPQSPGVARSRPQ